MYCVKKMTEDLYWVGGNDRRLALFENVYPIPRGVSYNAYVVLDEKTVLLDTVDHSVSPIFFENLAHVLNGRKLDYLIVNHMEPDHAATIEAVVLRYPEVKLVCNKKTAQMMKQLLLLRRRQPHSRSSPRWIRSAPASIPSPSSWPRWSTGPRSW